MQPKSVTEFNLRVITLSHLIFSVNSCNFAPQTALSSRFLSGRKVRTPQSSIADNIRRFRFIGVRTSATESMYR